MMRSSALLPWRIAHVTLLLMCSMCLFLPMGLSAEEQEIDLAATGHHERGAYPDKSSSGSKFTEFAAGGKHHRNLALASGWVWNGKPNKSSPRKKYARDESWVAAVDSQQQYEKSVKSIYDKKYFDYLPAELKDSLETPANVSLSKRTNSRRIRRSTDFSDARTASRRTKRHGIWYVQPGTSYSYMLPQQTFYPAVVNQWELQYNRGPNMYYPNHRPNLHNQYLPPATTQPDRPTYAIQPGSTTTPTPVTVGPGDIGQRVGDRDRDVSFVFDTVYDPNRERNYNLLPGPRPRVTTAPPRTTTSRQQGFGFVPATPAPLAPAGNNPRRTTTTPQPSIQHNSDDDYDWSNLGLSPDGNDGDLGNRFGNGEPGPLNTNLVGADQARKVPTKCTWAIANCCSHNSDRIRYYCFEQNQCYGAFWGENVCRTYFKLALREIELYYGA